MTLGVRGGGTARLVRIFEDAEEQDATAVRGSFDVDGELVAARVSAFPRVSLGRVAVRKDPGRRGDQSLFVQTGKRQEG